MRDWTVTYVLGGGVSAKDAPIETYRERGYVLGLNQAAVYRGCDGMACGDRGMAKDHKAVWVRYGREAHGMFPVNASIKGNVGPEATYWTRTTDGEPTEDPGMVGMGPGQANTMVGAMNIALHRGVRRLVLLGCDFDEANAHWYPCPMPGTQGVWPRRMRVGRVMENLVAMGRWLSARGVQVWNATPGSRLPEVPIISHEEACDV